jgi:hypothetical protein
MIILFSINNSYAQSDKVLEEDYTKVNLFDGKDAQEYKEALERESAQWWKECTSLP